MVSDLSACHLQAAGDDESGTEAGGFVAPAASEAVDDESGGGGGQNGRESYAEIGFADGLGGHDLQPVNQGRFVETILVVEVGDDPIMAFAHFAGGLGEAGLVAIKKRKPPAPGDVHQQGESQDEEAAVALGYHKLRMAVAAQSDDIALVVEVRLVCMSLLQK